MTAAQRTWILQTNPKLYDIDKAVEERVLVYWKIPQYTDQVKAGDRALVWRAGKQAGFVAWGVFYTNPALYDISLLPDALWKGPQEQPLEFRAPLRLNPGGFIPKAEVASVLPEHRIVTAPMGTVFPLDGDDLVVIEPLLIGHGFDLGRSPEPDFEPLPIIQPTEPETKPKAHIEAPRAKITPALFLLSSSPERPVEITIEGDSLRLLLVEREAVKALAEEWDVVGIYLLIGKPTSAGAALSVYVGKAQALAGRIKTGHNLKDWTRCVLVQRPGLQPFNASDISWLERRLIDVLLQAPEVDLINKTPPPPEAVPEWKAEILERTVLAAVGVLGILGAYIA
jgi:hypothetical protein